MVVNESIMDNDGGGRGRNYPVPRPVLVFAPALFDYCFFRAGSSTSSSGELLRSLDFGITCLDQLVWLFFADVLGDQLSFACCVRELVIRNF